MLDYDKRGVTKINYGNISKTFNLKERLDTNIVIDCNMDKFASISDYNNYAINYIFCNMQKTN